jgi:hypothetical protein
VTLNASTTFVIGWLVIGAAVAAVAAARGQGGAALSAAAIVAWPFLLPALTGPSGPTAARVEATLTRLRAAPELLTAAGLADLAAALRAADARVARTASLLTHTPPGSPGHAEVQAAHDRARAALAAVLDDLDLLALQASLADLSADTAAIAARLAELRGRLVAAGEVSAWAGGPPAADRAKPDAGHFSSPGASR